MMTEKEMAPVAWRLPGANEYASCDALSTDYTLVKDIEEALPPICEVRDVANFMSMKPSAVRELCKIRRTSRNQGRSPLAYSACLAPGIRHRRWCQ